ncbi:MAG: hypothetical protein LBT66_06925 [Methanobrevibacter sp.]|jgi:hypothetical protein|nr:hypothetical protein [Candidatus Methanovirga meridionalis]
METDELRYKFLDNEDFNDILDKNSENDLNSCDDLDYQDFSTNTDYNYFQNHNQILENSIKMEYSNVIPLRRLTLSFILSFGVYGYYWFYKNIRFLKEYHELDINVKFRTLVYILVPLGNFIVLYDLINTMKYYLNKKGIESYSPFLNILGFIIFGFTPLGIWFYINVQESFNEYWKLEQNCLSIQRNFTSAEIAIIFFVWLSIIVLIILIVYFLMNYTISIRHPI